MSKTNKLASQIRQLADEVWELGKTLQFRDYDSGRELKNVSSELHNQASRLGRIIAP